VVNYEPKNWLKLVLTLRGSVVRGVAARVVVSAAFGVAAQLLYQRHAYRFPPIAHTLIGAALALLLVFRTNASYDRFWEGRKLVGMMGNRLRDLARQFASIVPAEADERARLGRYLSAFYRLSVQALRAERDLDRLGELLTEAERERLEGVGQRPYVVLGWMSGVLADLQDAGKLPGERFRACDQNLTSLADSIGGAERIHKTPVPIAYAHHIKVFVTLFCFSVPFAMVEQMGWFTPFAAAVLGFALFGIDEIGVEIEDPFGYDANDLPLDPIGDAIERSVRDNLRPAGPV
jgi:ion channel-forming bestrophin family protein